MSRRRIPERTPDEEKPEAPPPAPKTPQERLQETRQNLRKALLPIAFGALAGITSFLASHGEIIYRPGAGILILFILLQAPMNARLGLGMKKKDWAGAAFLTFDLWFITWSILIMGNVR